MVATGILVADPRLGLCRHLAQKANKKELSIDKSDKLPGCGSKPMVPF